MGTNSNRDRAARGSSPAPANHDITPGTGPDSYGPDATLERALIDEFLATRGYTLRSVDRLTPGDREALLRAAAAFATLKRAAIEARAHLLSEIG